MSKQVEGTQALIKFGSRVREVREIKGISQDQLAALVPKEIENIDDLESGKINANLYDIFRLVKVLGISVPEFFNYD